MPITQILKLNSEKKHSVRYDADPNATVVPFTALYFTKDALMLLTGNTSIPETIEVTVNIPKQD